MLFLECARLQEISYAGPTNLRRGRSGFETEPFGSRIMLIIRNAVRLSRIFPIKKKHSCLGERI